MLQTVKLKTQPRKDGAYSLCSIIYYLGYWVSPSSSTAEVARLLELVLHHDKGRGGKGLGEVKILDLFIN